MIDGPALIWPALIWPVTMRVDVPVRQGSIVSSTNDGIILQTWTFCSLVTMKGTAADFSAALELNDKDPVAWNNRGYNRYQLGKTAQALKDYDAAIELTPNDALAHQNRAWLLATTTDKSLRNAEEAVASAAKACEINASGNIGDLSALAAAHADAGNSKDAVGWQEKVAEIAAEDVKSFAEKMLARYRNGKTYIADPVAADKAEAEAAEAKAGKEAAVKKEAVKKEAAKKEAAKKRQEDAEAKGEE